MAIITCLSGAGPEDGTRVDANEPQEAVGADCTTSSLGKCTDCNGFHEEPQLVKKAWPDSE